MAETRLLNVGTGIATDPAALPAMERAVCLYFVQRPDMATTATTFKRLEKHVSYTYGSMKKNPPLRSIELGVLQREPTKDGYIYRSVLDATLQAKFGALPPDESQQRVIGALS
jgi:hypothetical protein